MAELDPLADVRLNLHCPDCAQEWEAGFDIVSFIWAELNAWARRLLGEVHELALTYGWSEAEILADFPSLELADGAPQWSGNTFLRGLKALQVRW